MRCISSRFTEPVSRNRPRVRFASTARLIGKGMALGALAGIFAVGALAAKFAGMAAVAGVVSGGPAGRGADL